MKRALAFTFAALLFGVAGLAQISGSWYGKLTFTDPVAFESTLTLTYSVAGFEITSTSEFNGTWNAQSFSISGSLGPVDISGAMVFSPTDVAYKSAEVSSSLDFAGLGITFTVKHWAGPDYLPANWSDYCDQTPSALMLYILDVAVDPVSVEVTFSDCCDGIEFYDFTLTLSDLSLCCGIVYDFELHFTKAGFDYVLFSIDKLFELCCGISFGVDVKFGVDYKSVEPKFSWGGIEGCVTVWGDVVQEQNDTPFLGITGWELYGFKIYCELAECYSLEFVTAFDVPAVEAIIGDVFDAELGEYEYIKFGACGPACCGGTWTLDATVYFGSGGGLFDITRFVVDASVPIMDALTLGFSWSSTGTLAIDWEFTF